MTTREVTPGGLGMSVVICAYTLDRWPDLQEAVRSVLGQGRAVHEIVVVIDHNPELLDRARLLWAGSGPAAEDRCGIAVQVVPSTGARGLSGARNTGVAASSADIVAFLDDDARADPRCGERLLALYSDPSVLACGGAAEPVLGGRRPSWWPLEFDWIVGCSYVGLPTSRAAVRNLIGANMSARRAVLVELGGFPEDIGRVGSRPLGCEETDLCIRMAQRWPDGHILYEPLARVLHTVPPARLSWRYFRSRCFAEGLSKARVARRVGGAPALASERAYVLRVLPRGMARGVVGACRGEEGAGLRAVAIAAGLLVTTAGYVGGRVAGSVTAPRPTRLRVAA